MLIRLQQQQQQHEREHEQSTLCCWFSSLLGWCVSCGLLLLLSDIHAYMSVCVLSLIRGDTQCQKNDKGFWGSVDHRNVCALVLSCLVCCGTNNPLMGHHWVGWPVPDPLCAECSNSSSSSPVCVPVWLLPVRVCVCVFGPVCCALQCWCLPEDQCAPRLSRPGLNGSDNKTVLPARPETAPHTASHTHCKPHTLQATLAPCIPG